MKTHGINLIGAGVLLAALSGMATAHEGYLTDSSGAPVRNGSGQCWRTGSWTPAMAIKECDPELVKVEPAAQKPEAVAVVAVVPMPVAVQGPAKPMFEKVSMQAETLFDFDRAELRDSAKAKLDELVGMMRQYPEVEAILVTGHTDRLGAKAYNQKLSEWRAKAVMSYLVSHGIAAGRIQTQGMGETEPVTQPDECKGNHKTKTLITCLQPDRRVVVEITAQHPVK